VTRIFHNCRLYDGTTAPPIDDAVLMVAADGTIAAVGTRQQLGQWPQTAETIDLGGAVVIPGLVDTHSHIGLWTRPHVPAHADGNETSGPVQLTLRALDAINPDDPGLAMARAGGITTANIMPGSANVIGGATVYVKLRPATTVEHMLLQGRLPDGTIIVGGLKMANGENPKGYGRLRQQAPFTRMKIAALQREAFEQARRRWRPEQPLPAQTDWDYQILHEVLQRRRTVHFHCHRADDILTAVRLAEEFGWEIVLHHATEAYRVAEVLARKKVPVSLTLLDSPGGKAETIGLLEETAGVLVRAGVPVAINTDDSVTESRFFLRTAAIARRGGLSETQTVHALTLAAARMLHLEHRLGSLEKGKDADFVVLSGPPFSVYTQVLQTWIEGKKVFDRSRTSDWHYQVGGFALAQPAAELPGPMPLPRRLPPVSAPAQPAGTAAPKSSAPPTLAVLVGRLHVGDGRVISPAAVLIADGRIRAVGTLQQLAIPPKTPVLTAAEATPGLIDPFCVAGLSGAWNIPADQDQDELSHPHQAELRVVDGFHPREPLLEFLQAQGITIVHVTPGRHNALAGRSAIFRTDGATVETALLRADAAVVVNLGEVPKSAYKDKAPQTRMAVAAIIRKAFADAQHYRQQREAAQANLPYQPKAEALLPALEGRVPVIFAAHRRDDIQTALRIAAEFRLRPIIALGSEAYRLLPELKQAQAAVFLHPPMQRIGSSLETLHATTASAARLAQAGIPFALCTGFEGYVPKVRVLRHEAAMALGYGGLEHARALRAITLDAAQLLGIDKDYGSLHPGKVADLVLYDGDPFEHATHVTHTIMAGRLVYAREDYLKLPLERRILSLSGLPDAPCCLFGW
jgi:imidazolonepropionase-like amidohydrolase